ncbi:MAG: SUMF1/EgtB/PvdO family nonheme iron enzyme, partial [Phycisphaerae bacterium]|nr:SUMF1/EgtB/PvdO family nonheme iron enzyme [Phycisphaerae bacterium]
MTQRHVSSKLLPVVGAALLVAALLAGGCARDKYISNLADKHGTFTHDADLPCGFYPLVGLNPDDPNDYVNGWPRYIVCNADNSVMAYVPGGEFMMGTGNPADGPTGNVRVGSFYVDLYEVNNVQFDRFRKAAEGRGCATLWDPLGLFTTSKLDKMRNRQRPWVESNAGHVYKYEVFPRHGGKQKLYPETAMNYWFWNGQTPADIDYYLDYWEPGHNNNDPVRNVSWWEAWYYARWA